MEARREWDDTNCARIVPFLILPGGKRMDENGHHPNSVFLDTPALWELHVRQPKYSWQFPQKFQVENGIELTLYMYLTQRLILFFWLVFHDLLKNISHLYIRHNCGRKPTIRMQVEDAPSLARSEMKRAWAGLEPTGTVRVRGSCLRHSVALAL